MDLDIDVEVCSSRRHGPNPPRYLAQQMRTELMDFRSLKAEAFLENYAAEDLKSNRKVNASGIQSGAVAPVSSHAPKRRARVRER